MAANDFDAWFSPKATYDKFEAFWSKPIQAFLETSTAASMMSITREQHLTQTKAMREQFEAFWTAMRVPTLGETARVAGLVVGLGDQIEALSDRLSAIEGKLDALNGRNAEAAKPATTEAKAEDAGKAKGAK